LNLINRLITSLLLFNFDKVTYKVIAYTTYGENDSKIVNIQLNSYVASVQTDALLLDNRFTFETEYYRQFSIKEMEPSL
jgi:hypothetical protein